MRAIMHCVAVYYDLKDKLIFISKGLNAHGNKNAEDWIGETRRIKILPCDSSEDALDLRNELIKEFQPPYNIYHNKEGERAKA